MSHPDDNERLIRLTHKIAKERDDLLGALVKSQYVLVNLREHARHIRTCDAPAHACTCELDELMEQSIDVVHGSSDLIAEAGGQEQPHYQRQRGDLLSALRRRYTLCACMNNCCTICIEDRATIAKVKADAS